MTLKYLTEPVRYSEAAAALLVTGTGCRWLHRTFGHCLELSRRWSYVELHVELTDDHPM